MKNAFNILAERHSDGTRSHRRIVLGCKVPHELDALKWKATGRRRGCVRTRFIWHRNKAQRRQEIP
jgi:hypothetical protein